MQINLLPWRQMQRRKQWRKSLRLAGIIFISNSLVLVSVFATLSYRLHKQEQINARIRQQMQVIQSKSPPIFSSDKLKNIARNNYCSNLFWKELPKRLPENVYLYEVKQSLQQGMIKGRANNFNDIALVLENLTKQPCIAQPRLANFMQATSELDFTLIFNFQYNHAKS